MPPKQDVDSQLMLRVKEGDLAAFEELVEKFKQPVSNLLFRMIGDAAEVEDLAQNVFIQIYKSASRYETSAKFTTWMFTIARNAGLNEIRRRSRHLAQSLDAGTGDFEESAPQIEDVRVTPADSDALRRELFEKVEQALQELPENQRTALMLCREESTSYDEIAQILGTSVSATKSLIHRGRELIKRRLKPYLQSGVWKD